MNRELPEFLTVTRCVLCRRVHRDEDLAPLRFFIQRRLLKWAPCCADCRKSVNRKVLRRCLINSLTGPLRDLATAPKSAALWGQVQARSLYWAHNIRDLYIATLSETVRPRCTNCKRRSTTTMRGKPYCTQHAKALWSSHPRSVMPGAA